MNYLDKIKLLTKKGQKQHISNFILSFTHVIEHRANAGYNSAEYQYSDSDLDISKVTEHFVGLGFKKKVLKRGSYTVIRFSW